MKGHQGYIRIDEETTEKPVVEVEKPKKLGRPKKVVENV
jgi:hypothetical protein